MSTPTQSLDLRQSQNLVMTPQLQQAIKMLQLSNIEISELVDKEMENNPFLEKKQNGPPETQDTPKSSEDETPKDTVQENFESTFDAGTAPIGRGGDLKFEGNDQGFESRIASDKSLRDHLLEQLTIALSDKRDIAIASLLIDRLDENGYLRLTPEELAEKLGCSEDRITRLLTVLKGFDPTGIFAYDLGECLALQLEEKNTLDEPMKVLLSNISMLGKYENDKLRKLCDVNETYFQDMLAEIRELNPKPASLFDHLVVQTVVPDILMQKRPKNIGGGWRVELNPHTLPKVLINQEYAAEIKALATDKQSKEYLTTNLTAANWLIKAMDQRARTILKVAAEIIEEQDAFFNYGIEFLKPMKLKDIAEKIEMHESTVSRVTTGKYIGTPRGLLELKFFFSTGLESDDGTAHSSQSIKARIKALTDEEDPKKILSDDKIVDLLKAEGLSVARRTVAKYREAMNIGSSVERRRQKKGQT